MTKNPAKSIKARLLNLARQGKLDYQLLLIRYFHERLLYRVSVSPYKDKFYLKGGALLYAFEKEFARPTLDIDLEGTKIKNDRIELQRIFSEICGLNYDEDGVKFSETIETEEIKGNRIYKEIRLSLSASLDSIKQIIKIDIGFGDMLIPCPPTIIYPRLMESLPPATIFACSLETVIAEKFQAIMELAEVNSRYKDFYDIYKILKNQDIDENNLANAIVATFKNRNTNHNSNHPVFSQSFTNDMERNKQWGYFLKRIKCPDPLSFETVMTSIVSRLKPIYDGSLVEESYAQEKI